MPRLSAAVSVALPLLVVLFGTPVAAQQVLLVNSPAPGSFTDIVDAVNAAADGDTILVQGPHPFGSYTSFIIDGKSLALVGDSVAPIVVDGLVRNLGAGQSVHIRGISLSSSFASPGLRCSNNQGLVLIEDCEIFAGDALSFLGRQPGRAGLELANSQAVEVVRCPIRGGRGAMLGGGATGCQVSRSGGPAVLAVDSRLLLQECELFGGDSGFGDLFDELRGGAGLEAIGSSIVLTDVGAVGGAGGLDCDSSNAALCAGGEGLLLDGTSTVRYVDALFVGGPGKALTDVGTAPDGVAQLTQPGDVVIAWPGSARSLSVTSPVRENAATTIRYEGQVGDTFGLFFAFAPGYLLLSGKQGVFALASPFVGPALVWTVASPDGVVEVPFRAWDLTPYGLDALSVYGQCFCLPVGSSIVLSSPTALTILDDQL